jgi:hypothetical protein
MSDLNQHIDQAARFQPAPNPDMPINDQSGNASFALSLAQRQAAAAAAAPKQEPVLSLGAMPIPN